MVGKRTDSAPGGCLGRETERLRWVPGLRGSNAERPWRKTRGAARTLVGNRLPHGHEDASLRRMLQTSVWEEASACGLCRGHEAAIRTRGAFQPCYGEAERLGALCPMVSRLRNGVRESNARSLGHLTHRAAVIPLGLPSGEQCSIRPVLPGSGWNPPAFSGMGSAGKPNNTLSIAPALRRWQRFSAPDARIAYSDGTGTTARLWQSFCTVSSRAASPAGNPHSRRWEVVRRSPVWYKTLATHTAIRTL